MSAANTTSKQNSDNPSSSSNNPFDTVFDGEETDDEWWEDDDSPGHSPNTAHQPIRITQWPKPPGYGVGGSKSANRVSLRQPAKRYSVQRPIRDQSTRRQKRQNAKAGIKLVTDLTRPQARAPVLLQHPEPAPPPQTGRFVDLAALQALNGEVPHTSVGRFWRSRKGKEVMKTQVPAPHIANSGSRLPSDDMSNAADANKLAPSAYPRGDDLSPNDRPIYIGLSIPAADATNRIISPETASSEAMDIARSYEHRTPTNLTPQTPTIVITPAQITSGWSMLVHNNAAPNSRPRATSSVYSQAPYTTDRSYTGKQAPPLPQMPLSILEDERQRLAGLKSYFSPDSDVSSMWGDDSPVQKSRIVSTGTVFDEDESPILVRNGRARSTSGASKSTRHPSISTIGARRLSAGWWNYITTPFMTRSNTVAAKESENHPVPALPSLAIAAAKAKEEEGDVKSWEKQFSPLTPETSTTIASDCWWEDSKNAKPSVGQTPGLRETRHKVEPSTGTLPIIFPEFGAVDSVATSTASPATESAGQLRRGNTTSTFHTLNSAISPSDREIPVVFHSPPLKAEGPYPSSPQSQHSHIHIRSASRQVIQPMRAAVVEGNAPFIAPKTGSPELPPPPYSPPTRLKKYRPVFPPGHVLGIQFPDPPASQYTTPPAPGSPGLQAIMTSQGAIPLSDVPLTPPAIRRPINLNSGYSVLPDRRDYEPRGYQSFAKSAKKAEAKRQRHEKEDALARRAGGLWRGRGCFSNRGCYGRLGAEGRKRRRWYICLFFTLWSVIILAVVLVTQLARKSNTIEEPSQWLNLTGFPPIPTGLSTVAAPTNIGTNTGCVFPSTQWSCDLPKELQAAVAPHRSNQPNFLLRIQWDNSSEANATFANVIGRPTVTTRSYGGNPVSASQFVKHMLLKARQAVTFIPLPNPPQLAEQFFLGNTTDGVVSGQKAGEPTPFYISFLSTEAAKVNKRELEIRQNAGNSSDFPDPKSVIPIPTLNPDGTAAPANLLPLPSQQPIRLYDRGLKSEHYGFYTYYDRSIFLKSVTSLNQTNLVNGEVPDDQNGGARESEAKFRCTWRETRFLVQIWTNMNNTARLLNSTQASTQKIDTGSPSPVNLTALAAAQAFNQPGTFPYPITITIDRHGGDAEKKMLYCYAVNDRRGLIVASAQIFDENRGFGGTIVNKAPSFFSNTSDPALGGFDGGTGGCACKWRNFNDVLRV